MTKRYALLLCGFLVFIFTFLYLGVAKASAESEVSNKCSAELLIWARGSGQKIAQSGSEGDILRRLTASAFPEVGWVELGDTNGDGRLDANSYPASGVSVWLRSWADPRGSYLSSKDQGKVALSELLREQIKRCPSQTFLLGGYSQGAQVVGETLFALDKSEQAAVRYVFLIGEPGYNAASSPPIMLGLRHRLLGVRSTRVPKAIAHKTDSFCNVGDPICSSSLFHRKTFSAHGGYSSTALPQVIAQLYAELA